MRFDDYAFEQTAKAVWQMNESAQEQYDHPDQLQDFMESMAYQYCKDSNSFGTGGFQLTAFTSASGERHVTASVQAYTAFRYAEAVADRMHQIRSVVQQLAA